MVSLTRPRIAPLPIYSINTHYEVIITWTDSDSARLYFTMQFKNRHSGFLASKSVRHPYRQMVLKYFDLLTFKKIPFFIIAVNFVLKRNLLFDVEFFYLPYRFFSNSTRAGFINIVLRTKIRLFKTILKRKAIRYICKT